MKEIQVEIISPTEAKELNRLRFPNPKDYDANFGGIHYRSDLAKWQKAGQSRRVFDIMGCKYIINDSLCMKKCGECCSKIGSIHTAEILNEKEVIIK